MSSATQGQQARLFIFILGGGAQQAGGAPPGAMTGTGQRKFCT